MTPEIGKLPETARIPWLAVIRFLSSTVLVLSVLFISAGKLNSWESWAYAGMTLWDRFPPH